MFVCPECGQTQPAGGHCPTDGTLLSAIGEDVLLGTTIGVYRVARLLGIGGMGRVYKGVHPQIGSRVAIKILSRECSDRRDLVERFFAEAKAVNLIRHESIVNVLDLAMLPDGRPYIIMEYLDGAPLASLIEYGVAHQAALPLGGIARLAAEVLDALGAAHAKGIVHRDLKPDNIFVAPSGRPKVLDFGIAKLSDVNNASTRTGSLLGTPHYMSPEQAAGKVVDHRADLYAIGVILFECATGRKPFLAEALFDLLRMHVEVAPPSPRALRPDMPPDLEHVILTALAKAPDQRFATTMAMSMALQHATAQLAPDQWRPLTPPNVRLTTGGHWAPTPPASWSGQASRAANLPGRNVSTVSAGQVTMGAKPRSRKGLWIGVIATLVVGGGVAAAVVAGGGPSTASTTSTGSAAAVASDKPAGKPADKPTDKPADPATPIAKQGGATPTAPAGSAAPTGSAAPVPGDAAEDENVAPATAEDLIDDELAQLEDAIKALPAAQQKQLAAFKNLAKLSPKERLRKLRELTKLSIPVDEPAGAEAPDPDTAPRAPRPSKLAPTEPPAAPAAPAAPAGAWITSHSIDPPGGYDPAHLDVSAFIPWAVAQARRVIPDAQLIRIDTNGVSADGRANLTLPSLASEHGSIDVRFISPSRGKRDPSQPLGVARHDFKCEFRVMATPEGVELMPIDFADCSKEHVVPIPRCSFAGVWKKAIARKAPSHHAVGNVDYRSNGSRAIWYFDIGSGFDVVFSQMFDDDCGG
jgi:serine/threonine protein kinase